MTYDYIIVQAYRSIVRDDIGPVDEMVHDVRVSKMDEATKLGKKWNAEGLEISFAGKITGEDGEVLVDVDL